MTKTILTALAIGAVLAGGPSSCSDNPGPGDQIQEVQDVSTFPRCYDAQGHGTVHPCVTQREPDGKWIVWIVGTDDCPIYTLQAKEDVLCLNATKE